MSEYIDFTSDMPWDKMEILLKLGTAKSSRKEKSYIIDDPAGVSQGGSGLMCTLRDVAAVALLCNRGGIINGGYAGMPGRAADFAWKDSRLSMRAVCAADPFKNGMEKRFQGFISAKCETI